MSWETFKELAKVWYARAAEFYFFQSIIFYFIACVIAHNAVGIKGYIGFLYHCVMWKGH